MPYLLDTNHCIYFLNGLEKMLEKRSAREQQVITHVLACTDAVIYFSEATLGKLYYGVARSKRQAENLEKIVFLKRIFSALPINEQIWRLFGETLALLKERGTPISERDLLIACTAKAYQCHLVTNDADFTVLPEGFIQCFDWTLPTVSR